jgi:hypothetical protein
MHGAEGPFIDRAGSLQERARPGEAPLREKQTCQVAERRQGVGVLGAERRFIDAFEERLCRRVVALSQQQSCQVVEARRGSAVLGTERLLPNRERFRTRPSIVREDSLNIACAIPFWVVVR